MAGESCSHTSRRASRRWHKTATGIRRLRGSGSASVLRPELSRNELFLLRAGCPKVAALLLQDLYIKEAYRRREEGQDVRHMDTAIPQTAGPAEESEGDLGSIHRHLGRTVSHRTMHNCLCMPCCAT